MDEMRAVRNPSSRRGQTSITHLLNYTSPRPYRDHQQYARSYRRHPTWGVGSGHHAVDKSRYVHANYRFVVAPEGDYSQYASDADVYLDWSHIMQVVASSESQGASCPICLSDPVAPRMAKCGHIFCLSCLIRFMNSSLSDEDTRAGRGARWKKCPICEDLIYLHEVRPVRFYAGQESSLPRPGDDVVLRLMARNANATLAMPREGGQEVISDGNSIPWHFAVNVLDYARIMRGTVGYMLEQYNEEIDALLKQEQEDENLFGQDNEWTQKAIRAINNGKEKMTSSEEKEYSLSLPTDMSASRPSAEADFYFYSTPPHLYLAPLDIRILKTKYGSFSSFPSTLLPQVEHISTGHVVDDALRKRAKYLGHLPRGCIISFLECDWTDIVPAEILDSFSGEIEKRRKRNRDKAAEEERERIQAERIEAAAIRSSTGSRRPDDFPDDDMAPRMDLSEFAPLSVHSGATPPDPRPGFETLASMSTSPSTQRTVWGTRALTGSPELRPIRAQVDDGWLKDEDFLGTSELAMELEAIEAVGGSGVWGHSVKESESPSKVDKGKGVLGTTGGATGGGGGKKKKKQKITLMSTSGRRGN